MVLMNAGRLDRRLIVQTRTLTKGTRGGRTETWADTGKAWASLMSPGAAEAVAADAERVTNTGRFRIRFAAIDATENRIKHAGMIYQITGITEDGPRRSYLILDCRTISALT